MAQSGYGVSGLLGGLSQLSQSTVLDIARVRVDKWKTDDRNKDQARNNAESLQRNMQQALPTLIQQVRMNPASVAASLKLYRNLNALYDVLVGFTESAGAFGSKDDYNVLAHDISNLDNIRRNMADQLEQMAAAQDAQVARLTAQIHTQQQAASAESVPKRVIVDDNTPAKKTATRKKAVKKPAETKPE